MQSKPEANSLETEPGGLRPLRRAGALLFVLAAAWLAAAPAAQADPNELRIEPSAVEIAPGGSTTVSLVAETPATTLSVWGIDVAFDPDVVSTASEDCDPLDQPADSTMVGFCLVDDTDDDGTNDTVKDVFAFIYNDDGSGLTGTVVLAEIAFEAVGDPGQCSDLRLSARFHADSAGDETNPLLFDGLICIEEDAPTGGTAVPHSPSPRTSEPTSAAADGRPTLPSPDGGETAAGNGETATAGDGTATSGDETPADGTDGASPAGEAPSEPPAQTGDGNDGGGGDVWVWVLFALGALLLAAGLAWAFVRQRRAG